MQSEFGARKPIPTHSTHHWRLSTKPLLPGILLYLPVKMTNNMRSQTRTTGSNLPLLRRRPQRSSSPAVSCDADTWTYDNSKIVTSQCELLCQTGRTLLAVGSQFTFVWDSSNENLELAHSMQYPVIIVHPQNSKLSTQLDTHATLSLALEEFERNLAGSSYHVIYHQLLSTAYLVPGCFMAYFNTKWSRTRSTGLSSHYSLSIPTSYTDTWLGCSQ